MEGGGEELELGKHNHITITKLSGHAHHGHRGSSSKLRHSRHLLGKPNTSPSHATAELYSDQDLGFGGTASERFSGTRLTVHDNHKPVFTNCSRYQPLIKEEEPVGTFVLTVKAYDKDPPENGGKIVYTFVSAPNERLKFSINADTGVITTRYTFDRDEPTREKEVYLTVRATDNGKPQLDDVCTIKVTIEDINDNQPVFDKVDLRSYGWKSYAESVPQDLVVAREVMRISATDVDDGNNSIVLYDLEPRMPEDVGYFRVDRNTGVIYLAKSIDRDPGYRFRMRATATDQGKEPKSTTIDLEIVVVESHKKAPTFSRIEPEGPIILKENFIDYEYNIASITAQSNTDEKAPVFELVAGRTDQTNKQQTFLLTPHGNTAYIRMARPMDYESISEYTLTVRIQNKYNLAAETKINIQVEDVNDNIPSFTEVVSGSVLENEPPGTPVMQVRAIDSDATSAHNQVTYELGDNQDFFAIDRYTGNITTLKTFDREERDSYNIKVIATDNSPSALYSTGEPNRGEQVFRIEIADKNDHPPRFTQAVYVAEAIPEDANINALVTEVKALDNDTASPVTYSIVEGNTYNAFFIETATGKIRVYSQLDYENITSYTLKVRAFDGAFEDYCRVDIKISNVNDNPPVFYPYENNITIPEEKLVGGCITRLKAYDPDIPDREAEQYIVYFVVKQDQQKLLAIDKHGCLSLTKPLDRDPPDGFEIWQILIAANDENGNATSLRSTTEVVITLTDINDNAPFLDMPYPVIWRENQQPGKITELHAKDNDGPENGPPFSYAIAPVADEEIKTKFGIYNTELRATVVFDREEKKSYQVPIMITDNGVPTMTGTSTLTVIIGDQNDNAMKPGQSSIFVYNYKPDSTDIEIGPDTEIGRVYVDDPDDWDLPDKYFAWTGNSQHPHFNLNSGTGMITMYQGTPNGTYELHFTVTEECALISHHSVEAVVNVTVKEIPEEAVDKSGSIRFIGVSAEDFVSPNEHGISKQELLRNRIANMLNVSIHNVDVFTVLHSRHNTNDSLLDVRFSAHGSPYYAPEKLNAAVLKHQEQIERELGVSILMVNIDECLVEKNFCESSCTNYLSKSTTPYAVYTNTSSFVGVNAVVDPVCQCMPEPEIHCLNGGTRIGDSCECMEGFDGPNCEVVGIGFYGDGYALYPPFQACAEAQLSMELRPYKPDGLVFYVGPMKRNPALPIQDFMALELHNGFPVLLVDYGSGTVRMEHTKINLNDGESHRIDILWSDKSIEMKVDSCQTLSCLALRAPQGPNEFLNVNGPLQVGGSAVNLGSLARAFNWTHKPMDLGYSGCVRNFTFNHKTYNLGMPSLAKNADPGCNTGMAKAVSFGIDTNFLVAILVCIAILLILLLAVVVHRRKSDDLYKDTDDIRENIINYEDEGGGEGDMTGYDLNVLRLQYDGDNYSLPHDKSPQSNHVQRRDDVPDICGFLDGKKQTVDADPETNPFDDVRHYAYEGDGNTSGSLSSLASGTDEGDLNFDYLSSFGPRFRKLADMYGEDPSDEEDENYHTPASESWC
ncbi:hypothetical protein FOCC_FOCC009018 [Frankliniella occidentalis]|nr:hypothetical protein FOCC_FOCC009018 [Frankliniella occidentalis]